MMLASGAVIPAPPMPAMSLVAMAAEKVPAEAVANWVAGRKVRVIYALSESGFSGSVIDYTSEPDWAPVSVGRPMADARMHVVDAEMRPVPSGVPGVVVIASERLASGYLNSETRVATLPASSSSCSTARE